MLISIFIPVIVLTFFPIDVIKKVDGIFNHTFTHITVVPEMEEEFNACIPTMFLIKACMVL